MQTGPWNKVQSINQSINEDQTVESLHDGDDGGGVQTHCQKNATIQNQLTSSSYNYKLQLFSAASHSTALQQLVITTIPMISIHSATPTATSDPEQFPLPFLLQCMEDTPEHFMVLDKQVDRPSPVYEHTS